MEDSIKIPYSIICSKKEQMIYDSDWNGIPLYIELEPLLFIRKMIDNSIEFALSNNVRDKNNSIVKRAYAPNPKDCVEMSKVNKKHLIQETFIYVMIDEITSLYKIGRSKNPSTREKTLQSQNPSICIIFKFKSSVYVEKQLHEKFKDKRVRGEWFRLTDEDLDYIKQIAGLI